MSTLRERLREIVDAMPHNGTRMFSTNTRELGHDTCCYKCKLAAALVAKGQGAPPVVCSECHALLEIADGEHVCGLTAAEAYSLGWRRGNNVAVAPSLHKEGPDAQLMYETYEQYRERLHKEGAGGAPAAGNSESIYRCETGHTFNAVAHSRFDGPPLHCPECGSKKLEDITVTLAPLPLQRTLPDEQFKGVVVERDADLKADLVLSIRQAVLREVKKIYDDGGTSSKVYEWLIEQIHNPASPAGRAEQEPKT